MNTGGAEHQDSERGVSTQGADSVLPAQGPVSGPPPWPAQERRKLRWAWPAALLSTLALVLGLRLFQQLGPPGGEGVADGLAPSTASAASHAAAGGRPGEGREAAGVEASPQLVQATETAARVARATTAAIAAVTSRGESSPPEERSLELCGLGRLVVPLPPPPPAGNASRRAEAAAAGASPGASSGAVPAAGASPAATPVAGAAARGQAEAATAFPPVPAWVAPAGLPPALGRQARAAVWPELLAALEAPGQSLRSRAAAQLLRASGVVAADDPRPASSAPAQQQAQARAVSELARLARPVVPAVRTSADSAKGSVKGPGAQGDAVALRWALALCAKQARPSAACRRIGPRDLVNLAPEDSASWLVFGARPALPAAERQAAWQRAAAAPRFSSLGAALASELDAVWPAKQPGFVRLQVLALAQAVEHSLDEGSLPAVLQACSAEALSKPVAPTTLHAGCDALGRQMRAHGPDLAWLAAAAVLGQRLAWPEPERRALRREELALDALRSPPPEVQAQALSCAALGWARGQLRGAQLAGELTWLRQRRAALTGEPMAGAAPAAVSGAPPLPEPTGRPGAASGSELSAPPGR